MVGNRRTKPVPCRRPPPAKIEGMPTKYTPERRAELVAEFRKSGLSEGRFSAQHDVHQPSLARWLAREREASTSPTFVRLVAPPAATSTVVVVVIVEVGACRIRVDRGFDPNLLRAVVAALGAP